MRKNSSEEVVEEPGYKEMSLVGEKNPKTPKLVVEHQKVPANQRNQTFQVKDYCLSMNGKI